jgi:hypothetical protein
MSVLVAQEEEELLTVHLLADPLNKKSKFGLSTRTLCRNSWSMRNHYCLGDVIYLTLLPEICLKAWPVHNILLEGLASAASEVRSDSVAFTCIAIKNCPGEVKNKRHHLVPADHSPNSSYFLGEPPNATNFPVDLVAFQQKHF